MGEDIRKLEADFVVAGGGPGGCVVANDLSKAGKKVILVERGGTGTRGYGIAIGTFFGGHMERGRGGRMAETAEGHSLVMGRGVGGGTKIFAGIAAIPDIEAFRKVGIDLSEYLTDSMKEAWVSEVPDEFVGRASKRLYEAAGEIGQKWERALRFIDFNKCKIGCAKCTTGCPEGAKWTGKVQADEAVSRGATLLCDTQVSEVIHENGVAAGIRAVDKKGRSYEISGGAVVCASGGVGSTPILKRSGLEEAGSWLCGDPAILSYGYLKDGSRGNGNEHQDAFVWMDNERGILLSDCLGIPATGWYFMLLQARGLRATVKSVAKRRFNRAMGIMAKVHDDNEGGVSIEKDVRKPLTESDNRKLDYSRSLIEQILVKAGCDPDDIHHGALTIGHPGGTAPIGKIVDTNLETQIKNLFVCDTSVMPEAPGRPPALTVVCLGKRLAGHLGGSVL